MAFNFYNSGDDNNNNNNSTPRPPRQNNFHVNTKMITGIIIALIVVIGILTSLFVVDQTEQSVILRLGKYEKTVGPGLQTKFPFGIDRKYNVPTQVVQTMTFGYRSSSSTSTTTDYTNESIMLTGDLNIIDTEWIVQYKIQDPYAWLFKVNDQEKTIHDISRSVMNQLVGDLPILAVMTNERTSIEVQAQQLMQDTFDKYGLGVNVITVKLQNIVPPVGDVQDAFEDVNKAIQDMNRYINEGKQNYNSKIPAAQGEALKMVQVAEGYAAKRVNNAKGDVARFSAVQKAYETNKDITSTRLYIEAMEDILENGASSLTIIDKNLSNFLPISSITTPTYNPDVTPNDKDYVSTSTTGDSIVVSSSTTGGTN